MQQPATFISYTVTAFGAPLTPIASPLPALLPRGHALVRIIVCGACHTDVHVADGSWDLKAALPCVPGHEGAGVVERVAEDVSCLAVGERVGIAWLGGSWCVAGECLHEGVHVTDILM